MVEPEESGAANQHASETADFVGWFVRLEITCSRARHDDPRAEVGSHVAGIEDVLRHIEADFRQLTVPLVGRRERVLPSRSSLRCRRVLARWRDLLFQMTGDTSLFHVCERLEPSASDSDLELERNSDLIDEQSKIGPQIEIQIQNVGSKPVSSRALLGRFHPDHREPNIFDAIEYGRRLEDERRKKNEAGG